LPARLGVHESMAAMLTVKDFPACWVTGIAIGCRLKYETNVGGRTDWTS
jgi:hypothetical protein